MSGITTHILDTSKGRPAAGVLVVLEARAEGAYREIGRGETDADGRLRTLVPAGTELSAGTYRITFATGAYHAANGVDGFYPEVTIAFEVRDPTQHYHVPLLLNPFGYSTYRGS
ncbi:5-Hydroxyisourate Hydrolase [Minicystis rosea]|nr:5-Hydroxyisourate Hydrolase [Minicystis rosea]